MTPKKVLFGLNPIAAALVSAGLLAAAGSARADQLSDLQAAVQKLQAQIDELRAQQAATAQKAAAAFCAVAACCALRSSIWACSFCTADWRSLS